MATAMVGKFLLTKGAARACNMIDKRSKERDEETSYAAKSNKKGHRAPPPPPYDDKRHRRSSSSSSEGEAENTHLAFLSRHEKLIIKQKKEMLEILTGFESNNRYEVLDERGHVLLYAAEDTNVCMRMMLGTARNFTFHLIDPQTGQPVILLRSGINLLVQTCYVEAPPGEAVIGQTYKGFNFIRPKVQIRDQNGQKMFQVAATLSARIGSFRDVKLKVKDSKNNVVALITKHFGGFLKEAFTDADTFSLEFKTSLSNEWKAMILAAVFHVDMLFYESNE